MFESEVTDYYSSNKKYILADLILWKHLSGKKIFSCRFQRHVTVEEKQVNYFCEENKLIILVSTEQKGAIHEKENAVVQQLQSKGFTVLLISYEKIIADVTKVIEEIKNKLNEIVS